MKTLLDKVGCTVIVDFQLDQHHLKLTLKNSTGDHIWSQKECLSGIKDFFWVPLQGIRSFHASFNNFS